MHTKTIGFISLFLLIFSLKAEYPSVPGCPVLQDSHFEIVDLVTLMTDPTLMEPIQMAFDINDEGNVDIYFTERGCEDARCPQSREAKVKKYDGTSGDVSVIYTFGEGISREFEDGLTGIELDPGFDENGWIYVYYARKVGNWTFRIARFTFDGVSMDPNSEVAVWDIPRKNGADFHTAGAMQFDAYGNLWVGIGDNYSGDAGPSCLADGRGGVIRIHPEADGSYTIPEGNFAQYWAQKFDDAGMGNVAAEYRDPNKVWPELFAKGGRNPYTITVEPVKGWVGWGDCGPDSWGGTTEEDNFTTVPGYFGYPFWAGENQRGDGKDPDRPIVASGNCSGAETFPPAVGGTYSYQQACAVTGPYFLYHEGRPANQLPPQFHRKWIIGEFNNNWVGWTGISERTVNRGGLTYPEVEIDHEPSRIFQHFNSQKFDFLDMDYGPDGALYVSNYGESWWGASQYTSIFRVDYTGPAPSQECILNALGEDAVGHASRYEGASRGSNGTIITADRVVFPSSEKRTLAITDVSGKSIYANSHEKAQFDLDGIIGKGVYIIRAETDTGVQTRRVMRM